ncbi:MAG: rRNA maturation RNase YbeY [Bacteroidetes bacterium]|nr:rRNA maturation RNase YbeY [Bacteroidota bacterium]
MPIRFYSEDVAFKIKKPRNTSKWIKLAAQKERQSISEITYIFCSDRFLLPLNQKFLNHDTLTDIITFDYSSDGKISGEIYISVERVEENAQKFECPFDNELRRVMIHGVLHLMGYKDKKAGDKITMRKKEEAYLSLWTKTFHVKH